MLRLFNSWNYKLDLPGMTTKKQVSIIPIHVTHHVAMLMSSEVKVKTQKHLHVSSEPVQVVVGLLTFNDAVVF